MKNEKLTELKETSVWSLYERGRNYHRRVGIYEDTDRNYNFYIGNQWEGANLGGVAPVTFNIIKPIVRQKRSVIHDNLYVINYSSQNYESPSFRRDAERLCGILNGYASKAWEYNKMDWMGMKITKDAAINDEGIMFVDFDKKMMLPICEVVKKNDVYYGNENEEIIENQPYILIRKRLDVLQAIDFALSKGIGKDKLDLIVGDNDNFEESGEAAKDELDEMVTIVYKLYKENGTVHCSIATRWVDITKDIDLKLSIYPVAHFCWEELEGSARGCGEVRHTIPNQIEINKLLTRRVWTVKDQAYPIRVANANKIKNVNDLNKVGAVIKTYDQSVQDVKSLVSTIQPAQMSPDVKQLEDDLVQLSRELAGSGDVLSSVNPEQASGRAIIAIQQQIDAPITEQKIGYTNFLEDLAKIWLEYLIVHSESGVNLEEKVTDASGQETVQMITVPQDALIRVKASAKIDISPNSPFDKYALETILENLLTNGFFNIEKLPELETYVKALPNDARAPKLVLEGIIEDLKKQQAQIAQIEARTQIMMQNAEQFVNDDLQGQQEQFANAQRISQQMNNQAM